MKNLPNRITIGRIVLSIIIIIMLCFPYNRVNVIVPSLHIGNVDIQVHYFIAGILFFFAVCVILFVIGSDINNE